MLRANLNDALKEAMKVKEKRAVSTLRLILAALKDRDIAHRTQGAGDDGIREDEILKLLQSMIKQRRDSIEAYNAGGRKELAESEAEEIDILTMFLPEQMADDEVVHAVRDIISNSGASSIKEMGQVMALLREKYAGRMDFGKASTLVKEELG